MQGYFIVPPLLYSSNPTKIFIKTLEKIFSTHVINKACLRNDFNLIQNYLKPFIEICKTYEVESYINCEEAFLSVKIALDYSFEGVHFKDRFYPNFEPLKGLLNTLKAHNKRCFYSAHSIECARYMLKNKIDYVTLSPIFLTPNKGKPLGLEIFKHFNDMEKSRLFALGGIITQGQIDCLRGQGIGGFSAIRYFLQ
ncbi:thiamine phosphate synthase [Helicobacter cetorum]|uniref:thiamine phosphate synthase n=1 Tax=Helicobacter cetorum TaxID=138563 RepID=UPI000CF09F89|nr:thiamine phosphate synthase [Helicobacter cetorum]